MPFRFLIALALLPLLSACNSNKFAIESMNTLDCAAFEGIFVLREHTMKIDGATFPSNHATSFEDHKIRFVRFLREAESRGEMQTMNCADCGYDLPWRDLLERMATVRGSNEMGRGIVVDSKKVQSKCDSLLD